LWKSSPQSKNDRRNPVRQRMVADLISKYKLVGMSRAEISELLGPPNDQSQNGESMLYMLGPERSIFPIDDEWLELKFESDRVVSIVQRSS
jgi:hypothetical protein